VASVVSASDTPQFEQRDDPRSPALVFAEKYLQCNNFSGTSHCVPRAVARGRRRRDRTPPPRRTGAGSPAGCAPSRGDWAPPNEPTMIIRPSTLTSASTASRFRPVFAPVVVNNNRSAPSNSPPTRPLLGTPRRWRCCTLAIPPHLWFRSPLAQCLTNRTYSVHCRSKQQAGLGRLLRVWAGWPGECSAAAARRPPPPQSTTRAGGWLR
jgi:hypothetical protein